MALIQEPILECQLTVAVMEKWMVCLASKAVSVDTVVWVDKV